MRPPRIENARPPFIMNSALSVILGRTVIHRECRLDLIYMQARVLTSDYGAIDRQYKVQNLLHQHVSGYLSSFIVV